MIAASEVSTTRSLFDQSRSSVQELPITDYQDTSGRCQGRNRPRNDDLYIQQGNELIDKLLEDLERGSET